MLAMLKQINKHHYIIAIMGGEEAQFALVALYLADGDGAVTLALLIPAYHHGYLICGYCLAAIRHCDRGG